MTIQLKMLLLFVLLLPCDIKYGILNLPSITTFLSACNVAPSNGKEPHTNTYKTTPKLCSRKKQTKQTKY